MCELVHLIAVIPNSDVGVALRLDDGVDARLLLDTELA